MTGRRHFCIPWGWPCDKEPTWYTFAQNTPSGHWESEHGYAWCDEHKPEDARPGLPPGQGILL